VEFIKKCVTMPQMPQKSRMSVTRCQKEMIVDVQEKEKHKMLDKLPKVGVCNLYNILFSLSNLILDIFFTFFKYLNLIFFFSFVLTYIIIFYDIIIYNIIYIICICIIINV